MHSFRIMAPLSSLSEVKPLLTAGASEFYSGVVEKEWLKKYSFVNAPNARHTKEANFSSFGEFSEAAELAASNKGKIFITFNASFYSQNQMPIVKKQLEKAADSGANGFIINDINILRYAAKNFPDMEIVTGTACTVFNSSALEFYHNLGATRIVLPRQIRGEEMALLKESADKLGVELEAFIFNGICPNIDGMCTFHHILDEESSCGLKIQLACRMPYEVEVVSNADERKKITAASHISIWHGTSAVDCGLCSLSLLKKIGLKNIKIVGREFPIGKKINDVKVVANAINLLEESKSEKQFREQALNSYRDSFNKSCEYINCLYPDIGRELI